MFQAQDEVIESHNDLLQNAEVDDENEDFFEVVDNGEASNERTNLMDSILGTIEEILISDPEFEKTRLDFCREHCSVFEETEENKLIYTDLFQKFSSMVEDYLTEQLKAEYSQFSVPWFVDLLNEQQKEDPFEGEIFDMLISLSDFTEFKDMMLCFKKEKEEREVNGGSDSVFVPLVGTGMKIRKEEQEDGEERPDLDMSSLQVLHLAQTQDS